MTDCVIDASALVLVLVGETAAAETLRGGLPDMRLHAPHLIDAEVGNVLRRHERSQLISPLEAEVGLQVAGQLVNHRYPHVGALARRAWSLRDNVSFYDGLYVALASQLGISLITADSRLSRIPAMPCRVELV